MHDLHKELSKSTWLVQFDLENCRSTQQLHEIEKLFSLTKEHCHTVKNNNNFGIRDKGRETIIDFTTPYLV